MKAVLCTRQPGCWTLTRGTAKQLLARLPARRMQPHCPRPAGTVAVAGETDESPREDPCLEEVQ